MPLWSSNNRLRDTITFEKPGWSLTIFLYNTKQGDIAPKMILLRGEESLGSTSLQDLPLGRSVEISTEVDHKPLKLQVRLQAIEPTSLAYASLVRRTKFYPDLELMTAQDKAWRQARNEQAHP